MTFDYRAPGVTGFGHHARFWGVRIAESFAWAAVLALVALLVASCERRGGKTLRVYNRSIEEAPIAQDPVSGQAFVADEVLVAFEPDTPPEEIERAVRGVGGEIVGENSAVGLVQVRLPDGVSAEQAREALRSEPRVTRTVPNVVFEINGGASARSARSKPEHITLTEGVDARHIVIKFAQGTNLRLRDGEFTAESHIDLAPLNHVLEGMENFSIERHFSRSEEAIDSERASAEARTGQELPDLNLYFSFRISESVDPELFINALNDLEIVESAYFEPIPEPAHVPGDNPPVTPDFSPQQGYLNSAPQGVDARFAWTVSGGRGAGITIYDIEGGWVANHEDLNFHSEDIYGSSSSSSGWYNHGTAVLGEMVGLNNDYGITGIVPEAKGKAVSALTYGTASAINLAASMADPGDLILIELHAKGPASGQSCTCNCGQFELIAMEYWGAIFDAIRGAVAKGVVVVEAAGNGSMNLDNPIYGGAFNREIRDSGAILVGAGDDATHTPECWTNNGTRVDVQGWGRNVVTAGYGNLFNADGSQQYTGYFGGTSSASPIVTGSAAALGSVYKQKSGTLLSPQSVRRILTETGTQQGASSKHVGPLPDLKAAIEALDDDDGDDGDRCVPPEFPNDPNFQDCDPANDWGYTRIEAITAWLTEPQSEDIILAVLDTGVDASHPEFQGRVLTGRNFVSGGDDTRDGHGHGTHVAGISAAKGHNEIGMAGNCWECKILPVKVLSDAGSGSLMGVLNGMAYAAGEGARVINMSLGTRSEATQDVVDLFEDAILDARENGAIVVVAAGNENSPVGLRVPSGAPSAFTIASTDVEDEKSWFSNYGPRVDMAAPGSSIYSTIPNASYAYMSGTSMASPMVAGAAGCILTRSPGLSVQEVESTLLTTVDPLETALSLGAGRLNLGNACAGPINHRPVVALAADPASIQPGGSTTLTATATDADGDPLAFAWSAAQGTISGEGMQVTWTAPEMVGRYPIQVTVGDGTNEVPASVNVSVSTGEVFNITIRPGFARVSKGATQAFVAEITDEVGRIIDADPVWSMDHDLGTVDAEGLFTATHAGTGYVRATYLDAFNTARIQVTHELPTCTATVSPLRGREPLAVSFTASAADSDGTILETAWAFGDGQSSDSPQTTHTYAPAGSYTAVFTATDDDGGTCSKDFTILVDPPNQAPTCAASANPSTGVVPLTVSFLGSATDPDGGSLSYAWAFGDGGSAQSGSAQHTYTQTGTFTARFTATDPEGASCTRDVPITVNPNQNPVCTASVNPTSGVAPLAVSFTASATDSDGSITSTRWTFGDGGSSSSPQTTHTYATHGSYSAIFRAEDDKGGLCQRSFTIQVERAPNQAPTCSFTAAPTVGHVPFTTQFTSTASDPDGSIAGYAWTFGDGTTGSSPNPSHTYNLPGTFTVSLTVTDNEGATCVEKGTIQAQPPNQSPVVSISADPSEGSEPLEVHFTTTATDADGTIVSYRWAFGDGGTSTAAEPDHTYQNEGAYTATLTVTDDDGASASASATVTVNPVRIPPTCTASVNPLRGHAALTVNFIGSASDSDGTIQSTEWSFGDGGSSTEAQVSHAYSSQGTYVAVFNAADNDRETCTASVTITVDPPNQPPVAVASADPISGFVPLTVDFQGDGSHDTDGSVVTYAWDLGDGTTSNSPNVQHVFPDHGHFTVTLIVTDDDGATGSATVEIDAYEGDAGDPHAWPMFGSDAAHTGFSPTDLPSTLETVWNELVTPEPDFAPGELNVKVLGTAVADGLLFTTSLNELIMRDAMTGDDFLRESVDYASDDPTPAVQNGTIVYTTGHELYAYDLATERLVWGPATLSTCSDSSSPTIADSVVFIAGCDSAVYAFELSDGTLKWRYEDPSGQRMNTPQGSPTVYDGSVYQPTMGVPSGGGWADPKVLVLDAQTGALRHTFSMSGSVWSSPSAKYDLLYVADQSGAITAFDLITRATRWQYVAPGGFSTSPAIHAGKLVVGSWNRRVYALNAFTGELLWESTVDGEIRGNAALTLGEAVVVSRAGTVHRFNLADGALIQSLPLGVEVWSSPAVAHSMVYLGATDGKVYALGDATSQEAQGRTWTSFGADSRHSGLAPTMGPTAVTPKLAFNAGGGVNGSPVLDRSGNLYAGTSSGNFYSLERDGSVRWTFSTGLVTGSAVVGADGGPVVAANNGIVYKLDADGHQMWRFWVANTIVSTPCLGPNGEVYVGDAGGNFFGIGPDGSRRFRVSLGDAMRNACAVDNQGNIYVSGGNNYLKKFSPAGALLFNRWLPGRIYAAPAIAEDGTVLVSTYAHAYTYALTSGGGIRWYTSEAGSVSTGHGKAYIQTPSGLAVYSLSGSRLFGVSAGSACGDPIVESPAVDIEGNVYFKQLTGGCTGAATLHAVDAAGSVMWTVSLPGGARSSPSIGRGRALYIGSGTGLHVFGPN